MTWIRRYKQKKLISKILVDSDFAFSRYGWCVIHCSHRLLCLKLLSFHTKMILAWFRWGIVLFRGELRKYAKKSSFENFESALYSTSVSMSLKVWQSKLSCNHWHTGVLPSASLSMILCSWSFPVPYSRFT